MADVQSIELQIPTGTSATDPAKPVGNTPQSKDDGTTTIQLDAGQQPAAKDAPAGDRPAWLPENFKTPEEMAASYKELQAKLTKTSQEAPKTPAVDPTTKLSQADVSNLSNEYRANGKLSDETYKSLAGKGLSKETVDNYIEGQKARVQQSIQTLADHVGSKDALDSLIGWAGTALTEQEITAANKVLSSGDVDAAKVVLDGLKSRYVAANGSEPALVKGQGVGQQGDVKPFRSNAEVTAAMSDKRYKTDEAYRNDVVMRLSVSNF